VAFDQSGPRWLGISDLIAEPEGPTFISYKVARGRLGQPTLRDTSPINLRMSSVTPLYAGRLPTFNGAAEAIVLGCMRWKSAEAYEVRR
jgi:hypothetical protein